MELKEFLNNLKETDDNSLMDFCRKYVLHGTPYIFERKEHDYYEFRKRIAENFKINFNEIYISGSAKLGFSPHKQTAFSYDSDIDISIVSPDLFEKIMSQISQFQMDLRNNRRAVTTNEIAMYHRFLEYTAIGWIRPDQLPVSFDLEILKNSWFDFFKSISHGKSEVGNFKVAAGIFKSYKFFEEYACSGLKQLKNSLVIGAN